MTQHEPQSNPQSLDRMSALRRAIDREIESDLAGQATPRAGPPSPRPVVPAAPPGLSMWGPSSLRVTSPVQLLVKVAKDAHKLKEAVDGLHAAMTGEEPLDRGQAVDKLPASLLPAIAVLAHEIEQVHAHIGQAIHHLRSKL